MFNVVEDRIRRLEDGLREAQLQKGQLLSEQEAAQRARAPEGGQNYTNFEREAQSLNKRVLEIKKQLEDSDSSEDGSSSNNNAATKKKKVAAPASRENSRKLRDIEKRADSRQKHSKSRRENQDVIQSLEREKDLLRKISDLQRQNTYLQLQLHNNVKQDKKDAESVASSAHVLKQRQDTVYSDAQQDKQSRRSVVKTKTQTSVYRSEKENQEAELPQRRANNDEMDKLEKEIEL